MDIQLKNMSELEQIVDKSIEQNKPLSLFIEMPGFELPEMITNPVVNLKKKLEYYKNAYDENLEHKGAKGIRIVAYSVN
jgi:hypothetical protein